MITFSYKCTGCENCVHACPKDAIEFRASENGYYYPVVDPRKCINCGLCERSCAIYKAPSLRRPLKSFTFSTHDRRLLQESSSGGLATELTRLALENNIRVFSVIWDQSRKAVVHAELTNETYRLAIKSKYTKAHMAGIQVAIQEAVSSGSKVLVIGLPCENFAIRMFLGKHSDQAFFVDLFCGGAVNQDLFKHYISEIESREKRSLSNLDFRSKDYGCSIHCTKAYFSDGSHKYLNGRRNSYIPLLGSIFVRPSCLDCQMGSLESQSDLRIGDYFGPGGRGNGISIAFSYSERKDEFSALLEQLSQRGEIQVLEKEAAETAVLCRAKKKCDLNIPDTVELQKDFMKLLETSKTLWAPVKKMVYSRYSFKQKVYFHLPYKIKKMITK